MSLPSIETSPTSKLSLRFAEKTTSFRSSETSYESIAANFGVRALLPLKSWFPQTRMFAGRGFDAPVSGSTTLAAGTVSHAGGTGIETVAQPARKSRAASRSAGGLAGWTAAGSAAPLLQRQRA